jgi:tetratricopeptide (TPR) repeat protein/predicted Ser/Thr protein kinase
MRREVESLLSHFAAAGDSYLLQPLFVTSHADRIPSRIGRYEIVRRIGEGGMGVVYEARQSEPLRSVAIKVIRPGFASPESLRRFEHEAQILGRLQHAGIAHIYEAGLAEVVGEGSESARRPFFAMEYVRGEPLPEYLRQRDLDLRARLELFAQVCEAVEYAHRSGVIHRDLKPANIVVGAEGRPKILDFGVARVTDSDVKMTTMHTHASQLIGTLPYMSPEQVGGRSEHLDIRSDVYSLGVILYELVAGRLPYELADKPLAAIARIIAEEPPIAFSVVNRASRGDVETIVQKALEKDPSRRYASARDLASDIRHYLNHEPITARPPSAAYQFRKFAQRNKAFVGGITATFAALVLGVAGTGYGMIQMIQQRDEAKRQRDEAKTQRDEAQLQTRIVQAANDFLTDDLLELADPQNESDRDIPLRTILDRAAEKIDAGRLAESPALEANIRMAIGKAYSHLGLLDKAEPQLAKAAELYHKARGKHDASVLLARMELAVLFSQRAQFDHAVQLFRELRDIQMEVLGPEHEQTVASLHNLGTIYLQQSRFPEAEKALNEVLELRLRILGEDDTHTAITMMCLGVLYIYTGRPAEAIPLLERALDIHVRVTGEERPDTLQTLANLGGAYNALKQFEKAEEYYTRSLELNRRVLGDEHRTTLQVANALASVYGSLKKPEREPLLRQTLEVQRRILGEDHIDTINTSMNLARAAFDRGEFESAAVSYADAVQRLEARYAGNWICGLCHMMLGRCLTMLDRFDEAERSLLRAHERLTETLGDKHERTGQAAAALVALYERWNRPDDATRWRRPAPNS